MVWDAVEFSPSLRKGSQHMRRAQVQQIQKRQGMRSVTHHNTYTIYCMGPWDSEKRITASEGASRLLGLCVDVDLCTAALLCLCSAVLV